MEICGIIVNVTFYNEENGYCVLKVEPEGDIELPFGVGDVFACVGTLPTPAPGERFEFTGSWTEHSRFGMQFTFSSAKPLLPENEAAMMKYLASGLIFGVGEATARNIVGMFGMRAFDVLSGDVEALAQIKGISITRAERICASFTEQQGARSVLIALQGMGVSSSQGLKLYKQFGDEAVAIIRQNPYQLIDDVEGIGFVTADKIAQGSGFAADSPLRVAAGIKYALAWASQKGSTCLSRERVIDGAARTILGVEYELAERGLSKLLIDSQLIIKEIDGVEKVFLPYLYRHESFVARKLLELSSSIVHFTGIDYEKSLQLFEKDRGITLEAQQRSAVLSCTEHNLVIITGGPGTGKTTIVNFILSLLSATAEKICLCAPTGRAAKRMSEATKRDASTIHRLLEYGPDGYFNRNADNPLEYDAIIVDELSMVDISLMNALLKAVPSKTKLVLVGDADQLPSVGPGNVLKDMIDSNTLPVIRLTEIFRQAAKSGIVTNAHRINKGLAPLYDYAPDFQLSALASHQILDRLLELCKGLTPDDLWSVQVLTPMRARSFGTVALNALLQQQINPPGKRKNETKYGQSIFRVGDKVMHIKNNYKLQWLKKTDFGILPGEGVFNGDMGVITEIDTESRIVSVHFDDDRDADYDFTELKELEHAFAVTIHKSQGSEFDTVLLVLGDVPPVMRARNLLYTAVTRAKKQVLLLSKTSTISAMVAGTEQIERDTSLRFLLQTLKEVIGTDKHESY